jgi:hypothetical protein
METELNIGKQGAVRQSWTHDDTLRQKLVALQEENPNASDGEIRKMHWEWIEENHGLCIIVHQYWFDNHLRYLRTKRDYEAEDLRPKVR